VSAATASWPVSARLATGVLSLLALAAIVGPSVAPHDPAVSIDLANGKLLPPSVAHWFGTDVLARDVFSRFLHGARVSLGTAALAVSLVVLIGVSWGTAAGLAAPAIDRVLMWFVDGMLAMPRLLIVLALVAFFDRLSPAGLAMVIGMTSWPVMSRVVRARVRELAASDHVTAARALGTPFAMVAARHVLPATGSAIVAGAVMTVATVIPLEAALTFFGAGIAPPAASWGTLLQDAAARPLDTWWLLLFPSAAIAATLMSVNVLGSHFTRREQNRFRA
jgi:peptide/nickel transport system permease protein